MWLLNNEWGMDFNFESQGFVEFIVQLTFITETNTKYFT